MVVIAVHVRSAGGGDDPQAPSRPEILIPVVALGVMIVAFLCTPLINGHALSSFDLFNTFQGLTQLGLLTLGLGLTMIAGEFDLSVVGTYALGGMIAVRTGQSLPFLGVLRRWPRGRRSGPCKVASSPGCASRRLW